MRIDSSMIGMESARRYTASATKYSRFSVKDYSGGAAHGTKGTFTGLLNPGDGDTLYAESDKAGHEKKELSGNHVATRDSIEELRARVESLRYNRTHLRTTSATTAESFRQTTIRYIFSMFFGEEKMRDLFGEKYAGKYAEGSLSNTLSGGRSQENGSNTLTLVREQYYEESESTYFHAGGTVRTADGREIAVNVEVGMSRSFSAYFAEEMQIMKTNTCDPLVLNFDGDVAELTDQKFYFDIDGDGTEDEVSYLGNGSGYLALDKNGDGIINDGKELFGPGSGNGFADLAAYDEDGNGWIDENDAIWSKLKIWCKNADGTDTLYTLAQKGVGAICLQKTDTDFALNNADNRTNGYIRSTGIFLYENGGVGTVQHLDVAK